MNLHKNNIFQLFTILDISIRIFSNEDQDKKKVTIQYFKLKHKGHKEKLTQSTQLVES